MDTKRKIFFAFFLVCLISLSPVRPSKSQSNSTIVINADGSVSGTDQISRNGTSYTLKDDIYNSPIVVECNNILLDGKGFALQGAGFWGTPAAINLTCSNVTVQNFQILNWEVGILGAYDGNTISNNSLTRNERNVALYANNYTVYGNYLGNGDYGIRIQGNNNSILQNHIVKNAVQFWITLSAGTTIAFNTIDANEEIVIETDTGGFQVYQNNFMINNQHNPIVLTAYLGNVSGIVMPPWDNGKVGNYWSDYKSKYPNATEIGNSGIANISYAISVNPNVTDRYPLVNPANISTTALPLPSLAITLSPSPSLSPSPTIAEFPSWIILAAFLITSMLVTVAVRRKKV